MFFTVEFESEETQNDNKKNKIMPNLLHCLYNNIISIINMVSDGFWAEKSIQRVITTKNTSVINKGHAHLRPWETGKF